MSVLDDILGFFRDLVRGNTETSDNRRTLMDADIPFVKRHVLQALGQLASPTAGGLPGLDGDLLLRLGEAITGSQDTVGDLESRLQKWIAEELRPVLQLTSVERPEVPTGAIPDSVEAELRIFDVQNAQARNGAVVATSVVVALNVAAAALDGGTQILSLGQIEGFQQLVQNIIWGTGLADVGGLSFRPQITTSFAPLLERYWHTVAQAEIPGPSDMVRFQLREVFDPERRAELLGTDDITPFRRFMQQRGFPNYWADSYWAAHWNLPSATQLNEMVHRGVISDDEWRRQTKLNDLVPEAIPWMEQIIYSPFTRVDVRRMGDLGVLTDRQLLQGYADIGYFAPKTATAPHRAMFAAEAGETFDATIHKAEALVVFTRVFNAMPSIRARLRNGFIQPGQVRNEILALGVPEETATKLSEELVKSRDLGDAETTRELTTSQILRGYKKALISANQTIFLLTELGWNADRAEFLTRLTLELDEAQLAPTDLGRRLLSGNL